jgi:hypothetical protein
MVVRGSGFHARHSASGPGGPAGVNTIILMHFDGTNGSTTYTDSAGTVTSFSTPSGTASISTAQSVFGGSSLSLAATSWIAGTPSNASLNIGTGDFTIELRGYVTNTPSGSPWNYCSFQPLSGRPAFNLSINSGQQIAGYISDLTTGHPYAGTGTISANAWHALAFVRASGTYYFFVDGVAAGSGSDSTSVNLNGILFSVGSNTTAGAAAAAAMYIDELRISKIARYTSGYTPASSPFTID